MIPMQYDDATRTLRIGARKGSFPGMLAERTFIVVPVDAARPAPCATDAPGIELRYTGEELVVKL